MKYILIVIAVAFLASCTMPQGNVDAPLEQSSFVRQAEAQDAHAGHMMHVVRSEEEFLVEMIPHHQEAIDTSRIIAQNTGNDGLRDLAERIIVAQEAEIEMMRALLDERYAGGYPSTYVNMMPDLEAYEDVDQDNAYIHGMIMHHMMAVMMANHVLALEPSPEVRAFAQDIIRVQNAEIEEMYTLMRH